MLLIYIEGKGRHGGSGEVLCTTRTLACRLRSRHVLVQVCLTSTPASTAISVTEFRVLRRGSVSPLSRESRRLPENPGQYPHLSVPSPRCCNRSVDVQKRKWSTARNGRLDEARRPLRKVPPASCDPPGDGRKTCKKRARKTPERTLGGERFLTALALGLS